MSRWLKRLEAMRRNPQGRPFDKVKALLEAYGFVLDRMQGSHAIFYHLRSGEQAFVRRSNPVLPIYVKNAVEAIERAQAQR